MTHPTSHDALLQDLAGQLKAACCGPGQLVLVRGEAGIGKTTLIHPITSSNSPLHPVDGQQPTDVDSRLLGVRSRIRARRSSSTGRGIGCETE